MIPIFEGEREGEARKYDWTVVYDGRITTILVLVVSSAGGVQRLSLNYVYYETTVEAYLGPDVACVVHPPRRHCLMITTRSLFNTLPRFMCASRFHLCYHVVCLTYLVGLCRPG